MKSVSNFLNIYSGTKQKGGVAIKNRSLKKAIINLLDKSDSGYTIADLSGVLNTSTPKTASLVHELIREGLLVNFGKEYSSGGRKASIYTLNGDVCYFLGVDVRRTYINIGITDFTKNLVSVKERLPYVLENTPEAFNKLMATIRGFISEQKIPQKKILGMGFSLSGRIRHETGYSYDYFHFQDNPLTEIIKKELGIVTFLENDSNAMLFGEYSNGVVTNEKNIVLVDLDFGLGAGIYIDGRIYYGKSGFSGEFGHIPFFENNTLCGCGKKGCLETEVSGRALIRNVKERIRQGSPSLLAKKDGDLEILQLSDLVEATKKEDILMIELLAEMGEKLGKSLAVLINLFNPELIILAGPLAETGDFLRLPALSALNKYALSLVYNDTQLKLSTLGEKSGVIGSSLMARNHFIEN